MKSPKWCTDRHTHRRRHHFSTPWSIYIVTDKNAFDVHIHPLIFSVACLLVNDCPQVPRGTEVEALLVNWEWYPSAPSEYFFSVLQNSEKFLLSITTPRIFELENCNNSTISRGSKAFRTFSKSDVEKPRYAITSFYTLCKIIFATFSAYFEIDVFRFVLLISEPFERS